MTSFSKPVVISHFVLVALVIIAASFCSVRPLQASGNPPPYFAYANFMFSVIGNSLKRAIETGIIKLEELETLDLSEPGDPGFDQDDRVYRVFRSFSSGMWANVLSERDALTTVKGTRVIYNLRRGFQVDGTVYDALYAVLPNINLKYCSHPDKPDGIHPVIQEANEYFQVAPDHHQIIIESIGSPLWKSRPTDAACLTTRKPKNAYLFVRIIMRSKKQGSETWHLH